MDYFNTTRTALARESEAIVEEIFRKDLFQRNLTLKQKVEKGTIKKKDDTQPSKEVDLANINEISTQDITKKIDLIINSSFLLHHQYILVQKGKKNHFVIKVI